MEQKVFHYSQQRWTLPYVRLLAGMRLLEARTALSDLTRQPRDNARHVLIFAQGRSGTTLLASLLASTGYFSDLGEPLHPYTREVWAPLRHLRGMGRAAHGNVVAHVKGSQLVQARRRPVDPGAFLRAMVAEGWTIVHVLRQGLADQVLSECLARARGAYHKTDDRPEYTRLSIKPAEFLERYDRRLRFLAEDRAALDGVPHLSLTYEGDLMNPTLHQVTADRICSALGLSARRVQTDLRRLGGDDPRDRLENYDEIASALSARGIGWIDTSVHGATPESDQIRKA